jgi:magnesium transporter
VAATQQRVGPMGSRIRSGCFGMNFDTLPLIHSGTGVWVALLAMLGGGVGLPACFWRRRDLRSH